MGKVYTIGPGAFLAAVGVSQGKYPSGVFMAFDHDELREYLTAEGWGLHDHFPSDTFKTFPPGLYVWEGKIEDDAGGWNGCDDNIDPDQRYIGKWRSATLEDLARFNIPGFEVIGARISAITYPLTDSGYIASVEGTNEDGKL